LDNPGAFGLRIQFKIKIALGLRYHSRDFLNFMATTDKMRQATPMAQAANDPNTSPCAIRLIGDAMIATHPLINRIHTTTDASVLKMVGISDLLQELVLSPSYYLTE
jgi:hypothetical protein